MKTCCDCNQSLPFTAFVSKPSCKDGYEPRCRACRSIKYNKGTPELLCKKIYLSQCTHSATRNHPAPAYTLSELTDWVKAQPNFPSLYSNWVASNYSKNLAPSVDRLDDSLPYSLSNIQLMTWEENRAKAAQSKKIGDLLTTHKGVIAFNKDGSIYREFASINEALRHFNCPNSGYALSTVCNKEQVKDGRGYLYTPRTFKGFMWEWK